MDVHNKVIKHVTCISIGVYEHAVSKGNIYKVFNENIENYRIEGNHGKRIWISKYYFIEGIAEIPLLVSWNFDDDVNEFDLIDATFTFSDGSRHWAIITTPEILVNHFSNTPVYPPGFNIHHLIILKSFDKEDAEITFRYLDQQDKLNKATLELQDK